jgi:NTE family protein
MPEPHLDDRPPPVQLAASLPVEFIATDREDRAPDPGIALCLSGGGYRAMLFHAGVLLRLNELGLLRQLSRVSSVSGGSITAGMLGVKWSQLNFHNNVATNLFEEVVQPILRLAGRTIDVPAVLLGLMAPGGVGGRVAAAYRRHLFGDANLQSLPADEDGPRFVINATNVQSGVLWRFMRPYMRDYRVGEVKKPRISLAVAVAASSAFPPFLSPVRLKLSESDFTPKSGIDLQNVPYMTNVVLTDGGVYDNLGLETAWKHYDTILASDGGGLTPPEGRPKQDWIQHLLRILFLTDKQVRSRRKSELMNSFALYHRHRNSATADERLFRLVARKGAYWSIRTPITEYGVRDALACDALATEQLADVSTRLAGMPSRLKERLVNWGYAASDASLRKNFDSALKKPIAFPLPGGVG